RQELPGLYDRDRDRVREGEPPTADVLTGGPKPQTHERHPHDDVPNDHQQVVRALTRGRVREAQRQPERQDDDTDHLHDRRDPEDRVVVVVGGREPGEVQPCPADREDGEYIGANRWCHAALSDLVGELFRRYRERDHVRQVVEQLQRTRRPAPFLWVSTSHRAEPVDEVIPQLRPESRQVLRHPTPSDCAVLIIAHGWRDHDGTPYSTTACTAIASAAASGIRALRVLRSFSSSAATSDLMTGSL